MSNRRVLLICYYFPPLGLGGVGRPLRLFKKLSRFGYDCDILTVKGVLYRAYEPELLSGLDFSRIHRAGSLDPGRILYLLGFRRIKSSAFARGRKMVERFFPDSRVGWVRPAIRLGRKLCRRHDYCALVSTSPPISSHLVGLALSRECGLPWVADFRDYWTIYKVEDVFSEPKLVQKGQFLLQQIREQAAAVTVVNHSIAAYLGAGETITNSYDSDLAALWQATPDRGDFTIGLMGHQHDAIEIEPLLKLLEGIKARTPERLSNVRILQVGQIDADWFTSLLKSHGLEIQADLLGRQPRAETIRILSRSHLFYLGIGKREGPGFLPGRIFELIASGRPVIAYDSPDSEVARLLGPTGRSLTFGDHDTASAVSWVLGLMDDVTSGTYRTDSLSEYARQFSSDEMARKFASVLDRVTR